MKTRIVYKDHGERITTSAYVIWGQNHLLQRRQFAFDGRDWYYQPTTREDFIRVNAADVPVRVKETMQQYLIDYGSKLRIDP